MSELREKLEEAFDNDSTGDTKTEVDAVVEAAGVVEEPVAETVPDTDDDITEVPAAIEGDTGSEDSPAPSDDTTGKEETVPVEETAPEVETSERVKEELKAPPGWKPGMRENYWSDLPEEVKAEVLRREHDIANGMEQAADARKFQEEFARRVQPYQAEMAARGVGPMDAFDNYLQTAYQLRHAPTKEKAQLIAGLITQYAVDIEALDGILTGSLENGNSGGSEANTGVLNAINQAMGPVNQFMQNYNSQQIQQVERQQGTIQQEITAFKDDPKNEFYMDVKDDMANLLEASARRGTDMSLQDAYDRAILLQPDIAEIVSKRRLQLTAQQKDAAAKAAKAKNVGVESSSPDTTVGRTNSQAASIRGALEAAFNADAME